MAQASLSVVIPGFNAVDVLPCTLNALEEGFCKGLFAENEIIVADGGSSDATAEAAAAAGATVLVTPTGRGLQMRSGGEAARGDWFLFLHADTRLAPGWEAEVARFCADPAMAERAGYFQLVLDDPAPQARRIERLAGWRAARLGLPYGDQGLLIGRDFYRRLGGYKAIPLMEDVELVRRIGRRRLVGLKGRAVTSAARYRRGGWWARPLRNLSVLGLYFLGLPPGWLKRLYG